MVKIIILNGAGRSGKDTFAAFVKEHFHGEVIVHSTVQTVKEAAKLFGADETKYKGNKERALWSALKDAWTQYNDGPFWEIIERANSLKNGPGDCLLFCMVREPKEIRKLANHFGPDCITVLITRPGIKTFNNHADQNVNNYPYNIIIPNDSTLTDLYYNAKIFAESMRQKNNQGGQYVQEKIKDAQSA